MNLAMVTIIINVTRPRFLQALRPLCLRPLVPPLVLLLIEP